MLTFKGQEVALKDFKCNRITLHGFDFGKYLWLLLDEVVSTLKVSMEDVKQLLQEEPEDFGTLSDGRAVISEPGFYYLLLFVSNTPEAQEFSDWVFNRVVPSIFEKGYYSIKEEKE